MALVVSPRREARPLTPEELRAAIVRTTTSPEPVVDPQADFNRGLPLPAPSTERLFSITLRSEAKTPSPSRQSPPLISVTSQVLIGGLTQQDIDVIEGRVQVEINGVMQFLPPLQPERISTSGSQGVNKDTYGIHDLKNYYVKGMRRKVSSEGTAKKKDYAIALERVYQLYKRNQEMQGAVARQQLAVSF